MCDLSLLPLLVSPVRYSDAYEQGSQPASLASNPGRPPLSTGLSVKAGPCQPPSSPAPPITHRVHCAAGEARRARGPPGEGRQGAATRGGGFAIGKPRYIRRAEGMPHTVPGAGHENAAWLCAYGQASLPPGAERLRDARKLGAPEEPERPGSIGTLGSSPVIFPPRVLRPNPLMAF